MYLTIGAFELYIGKQEGVGWGLVNEVREVGNGKQFLECELFLGCIRACLSLKLKTPRGKGNEEHDHDEEGFGGIQ